MAKRRITQETFDAAVRENMEEFEMAADEALKEAVEQFESQGNRRITIHTRDRFASVFTIAMMTMEHVKTLEYE